MISSSILIIQIKQNFCIPILRLIWFGQLGFYSLFLCLYFIIVVNIPFNLTDVIPKSVIIMVGRLGILSGFIAVLFWFIAIEILHFEENIGFPSQIALIRICYLLLGISIGLTIFDTFFSYNNGILLIIFNHQITFLVIIFLYGLFFVSQTFLIIQKAKKFSFIKVALFSINKISIFVYMYIISFLFALIFFSYDFLEPGIQYSLIWLNLAFISQISISLLLIKIPMILLTTEEPFLLIFLNENGTSIYFKKFNSTIEATEQLLAGYLSVLNTIGSNIVSNFENIRSVKYDDNYTFLATSVNYPNSSLKICYIYRGKSYYASTRLKNFSMEIQDDEELSVEITKYQEQSKKIPRTSILENKVKKYFQDIIVKG